MTNLAAPAPDGVDVRRVLAGAMIFGVLWTVIEVGLGGMLRQAYNPIEVVWWRYAVHLVIVSVLWGFTRSRAMVETRHPVRHLARSMLMLTMPGAYVVALVAGVPTDFMWAVFWTAPATIMLLSWWWLGERPSTLWLGLAVAGALVSMTIYGSPRPLSRLGLACAATMQLSFVLYFLMTRMLHDERKETNLFYTAFGPFVLLGLFMPLVWVTPGLHDALVMVTIGVVGFFALYALDMACHAGPASVGAPGLFAHVPVVVALGLLGPGGPGGHAGGRAVAGSLGLLLLLGAAWMLAAAAGGASRPSAWPGRSIGRSPGARP